MLENILIGAIVLVVFGAAVFVWELDNGRLGKEKEEKEASEDKEGEK